MFVETSIQAAVAATPTEICAAVTGRARKAKTPTNPKRVSPSAKIANAGAIREAQPTRFPPRVSNTIPAAAIEKTQPTQSAPIAGNTNSQDAAIVGSQPIAVTPRPDWSIGRNSKAYPGTNPAHHDALLTIQDYYRLRVDMIRARTKLILQAQASLRRMFDGDKEMAAKVYGEAAKDEHHSHRPMLAPYLTSLDVLDSQQKEYEKEMIRALKGLPILEWARQVKGLGDLSLANIIGETTGFAVQDVYDRDGFLVTKAGNFYSTGDFKSVYALWKRMGVAVIDSRRQGAPDKGATADDWIAEAYSKSRRSVLWNVGNSLILSMGKFRPMYGEDVDANPEYTELQRVFAKRARYEAVRLPHKDGTPIKESATGKDSYSLHAANRAKRYTEKRLLRNLYAEWRRRMA